MKEALGGGKGSHLNEEMVSGWSKQLLPFRNQTGGESVQETWLSGLFPASQVFLTDTSQPLLDTMDTHDLSLASWMCPLPLAPTKPSLLACLQVQTLYPAEDTPEHDPTGAQRDCLQHE